MNQFEQLLTCAICLDRYRNPKLLPCQHSFCMEPCMDGLVDYVRRQVKCPECRAEHRIPYQGVQAFPTNVTLKRFLDLHIEITGELPDPTSGQIMERCSVCSEKAYLAMCQHCEKKICPECKGAHMDILRREIARINNQVRRGLHKLQDTLALVEKNTLAVQTNCTSVSEEVDEIYRRLSKALKDRTEYLRGEIDKYLGTEIRNFSTLKDNLEMEISNIQSNCDLADKYMNENVEWDDCELMDAKDIFLKTVDFIRNFELETGDYTRKVRFMMSHDPNQLVIHVAGYGELNINQGHAGGIGGHGTVTGGGSAANLLQPPGGGPGLMRSKSDHRLASQFRQQEERGFDDPEGPPRKFGEPRPPRGDRYSSRYGRGAEDYGADYDYENDPNRPPRSRYRSRFARHGQDNDSDNDTQTNRGVRFTDQQPKERERVLDTEDATRGPLSGISRLLDLPRVMQRLQESEDRSKKKEKEPPVVTPVVQPQVKTSVPKRTTPTTQRQLSEDDEIARIKRQNKGASSSTDTPTSETRPPAERVAALKQQTSVRDDSDDSRRSGTPANRKAPASETVSSEAESDESVSSLQTRRTNPASKTSSVSRRSSATSETAKKAGRSASSDSTASSDSSGSSSAVRNTGAAYTTEEVKQKYLQRSGNDSPTDRSRSDSAKKDPPKFQSRFLGNSTSRSTPAPIEKPKEEEEEEEETETSSEEETESEEESEEETKKDNREMAKTDIGPLLARSAQARESSADSSRKNSRDESGYGKSRYNSSNDTSASKYTPTTRSRTTVQEEEPPSRYGSSGYTSRFLNKSKSSAAVPPEEEDKYSSASRDDEDSRYPSGRSRYMAMKDRRSRLARSKSSHQFGDDDDVVLDEPMTTTSPSAYLASKGYGSAVSSSNDLARSRSSHALKSRENSPERNTGTTEKDGAALSSWARYLKNKYGNRSTTKDGGRDTGTSSISSPSSTSAASRRLSLGLPLRSGEIGSSDDDSKNTLGSPTTHTAATAAAAAGIAAATAGTSPRSQYLQKRRQLFKIGSRGSEPGYFTWPRGIAVGPDNSIVVADSSNHRVQVFDTNGNFIKEFGQYGNAEGEFDCLAGVAVNRIGQYIIADRYNHRIQVFDPSGRFLRAFGSQGTSDGRFNYPWGITTDALGFIYVCDKENHRVQVFQSDGTFVGKFGSMGNKPGQLEHPHYIAVSNTNRVIVSDSNNHRVQVFDVNGRVIFSFGTEGSEEGQFKFPRGVAVDDQGYIIVADSGNNRIQIFTSDGNFLRAFGCWGAGEAEFKGLEGIAVMSNGNILVCDRENHRVQAF
ncbi:RING finger protein nhl-1 [Chrysoperla carnea]|uniref:RING finger protein nhl-1 n=1 Tax=Chrysoperla carnea TaxID=189513 RepID=UPI001D07CC72|nr:RING finger protein nhl-1 [Chrysoperla carnea]